MTPVLLTDVRESCSVEGDVDDILLLGPFTLPDNANFVTGPDPGVVQRREYAPATPPLSVAFLATLSTGNAEFQDYLIDTETVLYRVFDTLGNWESGVATFNEVSNSLTRTTIISSSNGDQVVDFPEGQKMVISTLDAKIGVQLLDLIPSPFW